MAASIATQSPALAPDALVPPTTTTTDTSPAPQLSQRSAAAEYVNSARFHRRLTLPATDAHGELTVTYAIAGAQSTSAKTAFFIGGMMGGRFLATLVDFLGEKLGLRIVVVDRPGMGGSTNVDVSQRIAVWLETVPLLMRELNAEHVSIISHSCGVIYALNTIYAYPEILPPANPTLHLFSPWVHPQQSGVTLMNVSSKLPAPLINHFSSVLSFVNQVVAPSIAFSSGAVTSASGLLLSSDTSTSDQGRKKKHERDDLCREYRGASAAVTAARSDESMRRMWKEDITGANGEALLSLKKPQAGSWGVCENYETCPRELEARITERLSQRSQDASTSSPSTTEAQPVLHIRVFWAETDMMVGKKGEEYFDKCFKAHCTEQSRLTYRSETVEETDHESLCHPQYGGLPKALQDIAGTA